MAESVPLQLLDDPLVALSQSLTSFVEVSNPQDLGYQAPSTSEPYPLIPLGETQMPLPGTCEVLNMGYPLPNIRIDYGMTPSNSISNQMSPTTPCEACGNEINSKVFLLIEGKCFHETCARCYECRVPLNGKCYFRDGMMLCKNDYALRYTKQCERCQCAIDSQTLVMQVRDSVFHLHCFSCVICGEMLRQGEKFVLGPNGKLTCYFHMDPFLQQAPEPENPGPVKSRTGHRNITASKSESQDDDRDSSPERTSNQKTKRMRTSFKHHQLREMKRYFQLNHNPDAKDLKGLAQKTGLTKRVLQVWFQNARAKYRRSRASNPEGCISPSGCVLPQVKLEQCYSSASGGSARTSISPFEGNTNSSYSRSISPENRQFEEQSAAIAV